ncbi:MAG: PRC-barrel domain-containing protein [Paracoccus sp. (in: a-proteobacteria)]
MKNLYLTTAVIMSLGGAALAQDTTAPAADSTAATPPVMPAGTTDVGDKPVEAEKTGLLRATAFEGADVYTVDITGQATLDSGTVYTEVSSDWDKIGEIEDLVLDAQGEIVGAIAEIGGFLGMGEKEVLLSNDEIAIIVTERGDIAIVSALGKDALETREEIVKKLRDDD